MDSYLFPRSQTPHLHYSHPSMEPVPPQMKKSPFPYEQPWPFAGNYGHSIPLHICYGHINFPGYNTYIPSYPHAPAVLLIMVIHATRRKIQL
ncbi:hypothetical protein TSUD_84250 [Trifolium subterraneum]|uniref:Uncharacterized protein n=1 Tax=Trifolium subterraneum TaxID=3900 RepID=A0A2Z6PV60_TRISU|nr:hypothetical protein TSUD_84250 [Trifolium subterraneum]